MPETRVVVLSRGKSVLLDRMTNFFSLYKDEKADWILALDSDTCMEKRAKNKAVQLDEFVVDRLLEAAFSGKNQNVFQIRAVSLRKQREC